MSVKITFIGAGSTVFAKNVLGDILLTPEIHAPELALFDIDAERLEDSRAMVQAIADNAGRKDASVRAFTDRRAALDKADFVVNAVQIGGYRPCTVTDFEIPKKYGLRQTIADTLGIGGIFRTLRTLPVFEEFAEDIHAVCPDALFLNYVNPMAMNTGYLIGDLGIRAIGLCHRVQVCASTLLKDLEMDEYIDGCDWQIAGINHQAWLLRIRASDGRDLYPEIKRRAEHPGEAAKEDLVRLDMMRRFGYYITESSEHTSEYTPWYIKNKYPELIERYNIPLDEYPRRCENQIAKWAKQREELIHPDKVVHEKSQEYAASIIRAVLTDIPFRVHGNVLNTGGLIENLPREACVEVPCMVDRNGVNPCYVGKLPVQCAAINRTNINVQLLTLEAMRTKKRDYIYMAAMLDPHTGAELSPDDIRSMCDDLIEAHGDWLPKFN